jgi:hypothetical protein
MLAVPTEFADLMTTFAPLCTKRVWHHVQGLLVGAMLAPGTRTVPATLRVMGLAHAKSFQPSHRVLNRPVWSRLEGARLVRLLWVALRAPSGPLGMGLDDTVERRRGATIPAKGLDRDPVRSSPRHVVKARGRRWLSLLRLVPMIWATRGWAWPGLTVLAPSARDHQERGQRHQKLTDGARPRLRVGRRWVPKRALVRVPDRRLAVSTLWGRLRQLPNPICGVTRVRLDAARYEPAPPRLPPADGSAPPARPALADRGPRAARCHHLLEHGDGARLVWGAGAGGGDHVRPRDVVSRWAAPSAQPLGAGARPAREVCPPSRAVHGRDRGPPPEPGGVCPPGAPGSDVARGPCPLRSGDPAAVACQGDCPSHSGPAGPVLAGHAHGWTGSASACAASQASRVVSQPSADRCGCHRGGASALMGLDPFLQVISESGHGGNPLRTAMPLDRTLGYAA